MNIINACFSPGYIGIWLDVDAKNIVDDSVQGEFVVLDMRSPGCGRLCVKSKTSCHMDKYYLYNILEVYNKEFSEYSESFKKYERD